MKHWQVAQTRYQKNGKMNGKRRSKICAKCHQCPIFGWIVQSTNALRLSMLASIKSIFPCPFLMATTTTQHAPTTTYTLNHSLSSRVRIHSIRQRKLNENEWESMSWRPKQNHKNWKSLNAILIRSANAQKYVCCLNCASVCVRPFRS